MQNNQTDGCTAGRAQTTLITVSRLCGKLDSVQGDSWRIVLPSWIANNQPGSGQLKPTLVADRVDVLPVAGAVDPMPALPTHLQEVLSSDTGVFLHETSLCDHASRLEEIAVSTSDL